MPVVQPICRPLILSRQGIGGSRLSQCMSVADPMLAAAHASCVVKHGTSRSIMPAEGMINVRAAWIAPHALSVRRSA